MSSIRPLVPLLIAAGILLGGNGMQGTLIALRGAQEGFSPALIGFIGTAYFGGFLIGCIAITRIMKAVGHVRAFAGVALPNAGSVALHEASGYERLGTYENVGYKAGRWRDVAWFQKLLQPLADDPRPPRLPVDS